MDGLTFVWDEEKDRANQRKHRISFAEARTVFYDENAREYADPDHSEIEERFILLGISSRLRGWSCVTATGRTSPSFALSRPAGRNGVRKKRIGAKRYESKLRFCPDEEPKEPVRREAEAVGDNPAG